LFTRIILQHGTREPEVFMRVTLDFIRHFLQQLRPLLRVELPEDFRVVEVEEAEEEAGSFLNYPKLYPPAGASCDGAIPV